MSEDLDSTNLKTRSTLCGYEPKPAKKVPKTKVWHGLGIVSKSQLSVLHWEEIIERSPKRLGIQRVMFIPDFSVEEIYKM